MSSITNYILQTLYILPGLIVGFSMHEFAHAFVSHKLGDPTPKAQGRLTVNPLAHVDPLGLLMLVVCRFGWGKPVQVNPNYYKHRRLGEALVALAGVTMNFLIAVLGMACMRLLCQLPMSGNTSLFEIILTVLQGLVQINLVLMIFNLIPLPPLDGWGLVTQIFNLEKKSWYWQFYRLGPMILLLMIVFRLTSYVISPAVSFLYYVLYALFFSI